MSVELSVLENHRLPKPHRRRFWKISPLFVVLNGRVLNMLGPLERDVVIKGYCRRLRNELWREIDVVDHEKV